MNVMNGIENKLIFDQFLFFFIILLYLPTIGEMMVVDVNNSSILNGLTQPLFCACPKLGPRIQTTYHGLFLYSVSLRWEVTVHFVDIGGIVGHY